MTMIHMNIVSANNSKGNGNLFLVDFLPLVSLTLTGSEDLKLVKEYLE